MCCYSKSTEATHLSEDCATAFAWTSSTTSYFSTMAKVRLGSDIIKPFSSEGDVVAWLKKVRLVARLQHVDDVTSLLPLYLEGMLWLSIWK